MKDYRYQFAFHFFDGDMTVAKKCLQSLTYGKQLTRKDTFMLGMFSGFGTMTIVVLAAIFYETGLDVDNNKQFAEVFPLFRGAITISLYTMLIGWNIYVWNEHSIDYKHLMKYRINVPPAISFIAQGTMLAVVFLVIFVIYIVVQAELISNFFMPETYLPLISLMLFLYWLLMPLSDWAHYSMKNYITEIVILSLGSPFTKVEYSHTFIMNQLVSLVSPLTDLEYSICYYSSYQHCSDKLRFTPMCIMIMPFLIQTLQSLRMSWDSGNLKHPQMINALKYFSSIVVIIANYCYKYNGGIWIYVWVCCALFSTLLAFAWDLTKDWGFFNVDALRLSLRRKLIYKEKWKYYGVIASNLILRLTWTLTISPSVVFSMIRPELFTMILGIGEVYRRIQWNFFRMEWQQLTVARKNVFLSMQQTQKNLSKPLLPQLSP